MKYTKSHGIHMQQRKWIHHIRLTVTRLSLISGASAHDNELRRDKMPLHEFRYGDVFRA